MSNAETIKILVSTRNTDSQSVIISAFSNSNEFQIVGVENDETVAIIKSERLKPDVLIMDFNPPGIDGIEIAPMIHRRSPNTSIILICDKDENEYASKALRAGISGFLLRNADMDKLVHTVKIVHLKGYYISASVTQRALGLVSLMRQFPGQVIKMDKKDFQLNMTEKNIIEDIAKGFSDKEIANHLNFSIGTIRNYLSALKHKLKLKNRIQIVIYSLINGVINFEHLGLGVDDTEEENKLLKDKSAKMSA